MRSDREGHIGEMAKNGQKNIKITNFDKIPKFWIYFYHNMPKN